ncbi:unnamed protein product, partial [Hapterophycus canaliculatus]
FETSRLPLDHIFATAARVYRRCHLLPALLTWHSLAEKETRHVNCRAEAAQNIQGMVRTYLARRKAERRRFSRGSTAVEGALTIPSVFREHQTRNDAAEHEAYQQQDEEVRVAQWDSRRAQEEIKRSTASTVIQAAWRAAVGRSNGADSARRKLKEVLVELSGGQGRMHR